MDTASQILLIIVSSVLALFLIVSIVLLIKIIKVVKSVNVVIKKAEHLVDSAEAATEVFKKAAAPMAFSKVFGSILDLVQKKK